VKKFRIIPFIIIVFGFASNTIGQWARLDLPDNPENIFVLSFALSGEDLYIGCDSGRVFRSSDNGDTWVAVHSGITGLNVWALAAKGDTVFAGTGLGFFISTDKGMNWQMQSALTAARTLFVHGDSLFAGTESDGFYLSTDNGKNWTQEFAGNRVYAFLFHEPKVFAGNFLTIDDGKSWVQSARGMGQDEVYSLIETEAGIFAGAYSGVYSWVEQTLNWSLTNLTNAGYVMSFAAIGTNLFAATLEKGIFLSTDNAETWIEINPNQNTYWEVYAITIKDNNIFAATQNGVWRRSLAEFGISDVKNPVQSGAISVSPNPTAGMATVRTASKNILHVSITNVFGEIVMELKNTSGSDFVIDLSKFPTGTYFARFTDGTSFTTRKIIKE
jgi:hypothetical protein